MANKLDLADAQFVGFVECRNCDKIINLVGSMGLTKKEWRKWNKEYPDILTDKDHAEIEEHFKGGE